MRADSARISNLSKLLGVISMNTHREDYGQRQKDFFPPKKYKTNATDEIVVIENLDVETWVSCVMASGNRTLGSG